MKKTFKVFARTVSIVLVTLFGFMMAGCSQPSSGEQPNDDITPVASDFNISGYSAIADGSPKEVSISPKQGKSQGTITIWYEGTEGTVYSKSKTAPSAVGKYTVTFDVAASAGFKAVTGLIAGTLVISKQTDNPVDPVIADFTISGHSAIYDGDPKELSITPKSDKSQGVITIWYEGTEGTVYPRSSDAPSAVGKYTVTFDVAEALGFNAVSGLNAGTLTISGQAAVTVDPVAGDFNISGHSAIFDGEPQEVNITPKAGKSQGVITIWYEGISPTNYLKSTTAPSAVGKYTVTFDVAQALGFNAVTDLSAGTLTISEQTAVTVDPVADDFTISGLDAIYDGSAKEVSVSPKAGKSQGAITVYYEGTKGTDYIKSTTAPSAAGEYIVTFDVEEALGFNEVSGLVAGTLVIEEVITDPKKIIDFESDWDNTGYGERKVSWGGFGWTVSGVVTTTDTNDRRDGTKSIRLRGNEGDNCRVELDSYLTGIKSIYFDYASYGSHSNGAIALYYQIKDGSWVKAGESVTAPAWEGFMRTAKFDLNKTAVRFKIVREGGLANSTSVNIDNIVITGDSENSFTIVPVDVDPVATDYNISGTGTVTYDGSAKAVTITPKADKSQGARTIWYEGISPTSYVKSTTAPSAAGSYAVTFDVAKADGFNAKTGLVAGTLTITSASDTVITIDFEGSEWAGTAYSARDVTSDGRKWKVSGVGNMDTNDRYVGTRSIRFRGGNTADTGDNTNRVELLDYLPNGIKTISFDYASYSSHSNGTIIVSYQKEGGEWVEVNRVTGIPTWANGGSKMLNASFNVNQTGSIRFKIEKLYVGSGSISANIDNIVITY